MLERLERWIAFLAEMFQQVSTAILVVMLVLNAANITSRIVVGTDLGPLLPWTVTLFVWMVFIGFFPLCRHGNDVAVEFLVRRMGWLKTASAVCTDVLTFLLAGFLLVQAPEVIGSQVGAIPLVGIERYWLTVPLLVSCLLLMFDALLRIAGRVADVRKADA